MPAVRRDRRVAERPATKAWPGVETACIGDRADTPTLIECWRTAPYMHDGHYTTIQQLLKEGKHGSVSGDVEGLTDQERKDLVEFVLSL